MVIEGEPWFATADACRILALKAGVDGSFTRHTQKLAADEKRVVRRDGSNQSVWGDSRGSVMTFISEPGLYKLIARSNKPEAKLFDRWVRHDVLPSIRKTGGYLLNEDMRATAGADVRDGPPVPNHAFLPLLI
ncbi:MAG TPA: BRO family protein [Sphingobium sp.]|nr:BRO family protein [Sphingobium sp.]